MRFADLRLKAYGGFQDRILTFPRRETDFHVVLGANEAGKTTALRAISALLFGFTHRVEDDYRFGAIDLRVGATLENSGKDGLCIYRKRGRVRTLVDEADNFLADDCLVPYLNGVGQSFFELVFGLNHERLRRGGQELAENRGDLAESLFAAGAGVEGLRETLTALREEADKLFKPQAQKPTINSAIREHQDALRAVRESSVGVTAWKHLHDDHAFARKHQEEVNAEVQRKSEQVTRLERIQHNLPQLERRRVLLEQLAGLTDVPDVREDQVSRRKTAQEQAHDAEKSQSRAKEEIERLESELAGIEVDEALLAQENEVEEILSDRTRMQAVLNDLPGVEGKNELVRGRIAELLKDAALAADADSVTGGLPGSPELNKLRALVREHQSLTEARDQLADAHRDAQLNLKPERETLAVLPPEVQTDTLQDSVDIVADEGPLERELETARYERSELDRVFDQRSAALSPWHFEPDELAGLQLPSIATVDSYAERFGDLEGNIDKAQQKVTEAQAEDDDTRAELDSLAAGLDVPTPEAVEEARRVREEIWGLLRRAFIDGSEDVSGEAKAYDSRRDLPEAYEHQVSHADELSDRRHAEAERIAHHQAATVRLGKAKKQLTRSETQLARARTQHEQLQAEWESQWEAINGNPRNSAEMRAWLTAREQVLESWRDIAVAQERTQQLEARISEARESLALGLETAGLSRPEHPDGLMVLLKKARKLLQSANAASTKRQGIAERIGLLERQAESAEERLKANDEDAKEWRKRWGVAVKAVKRGTEATPAEIEAVIEDIEQIRNLAIEREQHKARLQEMQTFISQYQEQVNALAKVLAPDLVAADPLKIVSHLGGALNDSRKAHERREQLEKDYERQQKNLRESTRSAKEAQKELSALFVELGCKDLEALIELEPQAEDKRRLQAELDEVARALIAANFGHSMEAIIAEAGEVSGDGIPGQLDSLRVEITGIQEQQREAAESVGRLQSDLNRMDGNDRAALAQQTAEERLATIEEAARRFMRTEVAWLLVNRAIERYQEQNQGPLLDRAGEIFREITNDSFDRLTVEYLDTGPVLLGSRPGSSSLLLVQMSDGTRDQLFLSIRLAAVERHVEQRGSLPLILDDILVNFDDARSSATLRLLADLSRRTQVIFLSHHSHLADLAKSELGEGLVAYHSL